MYLNYLVKVPTVPGKITRSHNKKSGSTYIQYEYDRIYSPEKKSASSKRVTIGKLSGNDPTLMYPTESFQKYFPDEDLFADPAPPSRCHCLQVGAWIVIRKIIQECGLPDLLGKDFRPDEVGLLLDLAAYSVICENYSRISYPHDYAYHHPLFTDEMEQYGKSSVCQFLDTITDFHIDDFLTAWNRRRDRGEKIYISCETADNNCRPGDVELVEEGYYDEDRPGTDYDCAVAYGGHNREPLFYENYLCKLSSMSLLRNMLGTADGYGYKNVDLILDHGYFTKKDIRDMDRGGNGFLILAKGEASFVRDLCLEHKGTFEEDKACGIPDYGVYGKTVRHGLFEGDGKDRFFHLYYSAELEKAQRREFEYFLEVTEDFLNEFRGDVYEFEPVYERFFSLRDEEGSGKFLSAERRPDAIEREMRLAGYFCIVTSEEMTARSAMDLYAGKDGYERLFSPELHYFTESDDYDDDETGDFLPYRPAEPRKAKIFIDFLALIIRSKIYTCLKDEEDRLRMGPDYTTVPEAIGKLERIDMQGYADNIYILAQNPTADQAAILRAFGIDTGSLRKQASELSRQMKEYFR